MVHDENPLTVEDSWTEPGGLEVIAFEADPRLDYQAGQWVQLALPVPDAVDAVETRSFSIASAPHEDRILVGTIVAHGGEASPFKRMLSALEPGDEVIVTPPSGSFVLPERADATFVLMGIGIGTTTTRSLAMDAAAREWAAHVLATPVDGNGEPGYPFEEDFQRLEKEHDHIAYQKLTDVVWDPETLAGLIPHPLGNTRWYVSGPPGPVTQVRAALLEAGLTKDRIKVEPFAGY